MVLDILTVFIALSFLILIHELGHFLAARFFNILVEEFGIGLPPRLFGWKIGETLYSINLLPIGGFVKVHGEDDDSYHKSKFKKPDRAFCNKPWWQRSIVLTCGVLMNFLVAVLIISYLFTSGVATPDKVIIGEVVEGAPAFIAGIKSNDTIIEVAGKKITEVPQVTQLIAKNLEKEVNIKLERLDGERKETIDIQLIPRKNPPSGQGAIGVVLEQKIITKKYPFYLAPYHGLLTSFKMSFTLLKGIVGVFWNFIFAFKVPKDAAGPIGLYQIYSEMRKFGILAVLEVTGLISLNLAVINLFPIPPLDGSRLFLVILERIRGKKINKQLEYRFFQICFVLMILLFFLISIQDIKRLLE